MAVMHGYNSRLCFILHLDTYWRTFDHFITPYWSFENVQTLIEDRTAPFYCYGVFCLCYLLTYFTILWKPFQMYFTTRAMEPLCVRIERFCLYASKLCKLKPAVSIHWGRRLWVWERPFLVLFVFFSSVLCYLCKRLVCFHTFFFSIF